MIDWTDVTEGFNGIYKKKYTTKQMLVELYDRFHSMKRAGEFLGVSSSAFQRQLLIHGIEIRKPGWGNRRDLVLNDVDMEGRTAPEIAAETGERLANIHNYARSRGIKLKSARGLRRGLGRTP